MIETHGIQQANYPGEHVYLVDLHLCFPQLPFIALQVPLQLQIVVLKAAD